MRVLRGKKVLRFVKEIIAKGLGVDVVAEVEKKRKAGMSVTHCTLQFLEI